MFKNNAFNIHKMLTTILSFIGIVIIFIKYNKIAIDFLYIIALVFAMSFQSFVGVKLKHLQSNATGGLLFSLPFFISVFGFIGYYYLIKHTSIFTIGIIPLMTPVFALILGFYINNEVLNTTQIIGMILMLFL